MIQFYATHGSLYMDTRNVSYKVLDSAAGCAPLLRFTFLCVFHPFLILSADVKAERLQTGDPESNVYVLLANQIKDRRH